MKAIGSRASGGMLPAAACIWLAASAWLRPLTLPDEGRYAGVAWEMLRSREWLSPTLDGLPYFHKPPLFYWITAASLDWLGMSEFAARMAPLLGACIAACALYCFARRRAGQDVAAASLLALVTQPLFFMSAQYANLDMLVAGCIAATVLALGNAALAQEKSRELAWSLAAAYLFAALGVLAKGLIGFVLPALVIGSWLLAERRWRVIARLLWLPGVVLFLAVAAPWFVAMQLRYPGFGHYFFVVQHFQRYAQGGFNNAQPWWFYPAVLALFALPWSVWAATAARPADWRDAGMGAVRRLMWLWLLLVTLFFSLPQSKLVGYILPTAVPLAFLAGDAAVRLSERSAAMRRLWRACAAIAPVLCLAIAGYAAFFIASPQREIGQVLRKQMSPGDPVFFVDEYYFAVPFYARLQAPVLVVTDWAAAEAKRDNWRKELADAGQFAPGRRVLLSHGELESRVCGPAQRWLLGSRQHMARRAWPEGAREVAFSRELALWRVPPMPGGVSASPCPGRPSASSGGKS